MKQLKQWPIGSKRSDDDLLIGLEVARITNIGARLDDFEVCIPQGRHLDSGHVRLPHRAFYTIRLSSRLRRRSDVRISIDGKQVGTWRLPANGVIEIERPANDIGRFTFYRLGSAGAAAAALKETNELGLLSATFMPELDEDLDVRFSRRQGDERGGTGLSGVSEQKFVSAQSIYHDLQSFRTINLRLVAIDISARPLMPISSPIPSPLP